jgi:serine phosphatase RsbU (regulator of sigma subunit)
MAVPPSSSQVRVSSAGHPPPILALPDREAKLLEVGRDLPLGVTLDHPRTTTAVRLPPGATLVLYTDGLIERRGESLDVGLERLRQVVTTEPPDLMCRRVMFRLVGTTSPDDDIALVAARRPTGTPRGSAARKPTGRNGSY